MLGIAVVVAFLAAGLFVGRAVRARSTDSDKVAAPQDALPVLLPSGYGEENAPVPRGADPVAFVAAASRRNAQTAARVVPSPVRATSTTAAAPTVSSAPSASSTTAAVSSTTGALGSTVTSGPTLGEPPVPASSLPVIPPGADLARRPAGEGIVQILDPCADGGAGCPSGIGMTVLGQGREDLVIREVTASFTPARFALYDECIRDHPSGPNQAVLAIVSNHPAEFTINGRWGSGHASTSRNQRSHFDTDRGHGDLHDVVTCAALNPAGVTGEISIDGIDDLHSAAHLTTVLTAPLFAHKRPPTTVTRAADSAVQVTVPLRPNESAEVVGISDPDGSGRDAACRAPTAPAGDSTSTQRTYALPASLIGSASYPFDPAWDRAAIVDVTLTAGSSPYDLCVRWLSRARSFDTPHLVDAETRVVVPPTRTEARVSVEGVVPEPGQTIDPRLLGVELSNAAGAPRCAIDDHTGAFPLAVGPSWYATGVPMCVLHTGATGEWTRSTITYRGVARAANIRLATRVCRSDDPQQLCIGRFTEWYKADIPRADGRPGIGVVDLRFEYSRPRGTGTTNAGIRDSWQVHEPRPVTLDGSESASPLAQQPQLDLFRTTIRPEGGNEGRSLLVLQWFADRAVNVVARVDYNNRANCRRDPRPEVRSPAAASSGTLRIAGLCAGTTSHVGLTLTDAATGQTSSFSDLEGVHADRVGPGFTATTNGIPVEYSPRLVHNPVDRFPPGTTIRTLRTFLWVNGQVAIEDNPEYEEPRFLLADPPRLEALPCATATDYSWAPDTYRSSDPHRPATRPPTLSAVWGEDLAIHVEVWVFVSNTPCGPGHRGEIHPQEMRRYDVDVTTAGPSSALGNPHATYGADLDTSGAPIYFGVRSIVVDLGVRGA
jgi:hypothetical protein